MEENSSAKFESAVSDPAAQQKINKKILLAVLAVILLCCLCLALIIGGFAVTRAFNGSLSEDTPAKPARVTVEVAPQAPSAPQKTPTASEPSTAGSGLGVSRAEMMDFFGSGEAFEFKKPMNTQGQEMVMGFHNWICVEAACAIAMLIGPEEELEGVSLVVPLDPNDDKQSLTAMMLLMTLPGHFTSRSSTVPVDVLDFFKSTYAKQQTKEATFKDNGYTFKVNYNATDGMATVAVRR